MTKHHPGYLLPPVADADRICFRVSVPNDQQHIAAFLGQLAELGFWYNWQRDATHFGKDVAETWRGIQQDVAVNYSNGSFFMGDCTVDFCDEVRTCPPNIRTSATGLQWFNPATGLWENIPGAAGDPRTDGTVTGGWPHPPMGQTGQCLAAANITAFLKQHNDNLIATGYVASALFTILPVLLVLTELVFLPAGLILAALFEIASVYAGLNAADLSTAFTSGAYDAIRCAINCHCTADGSIDSAAILLMKADVAAYGNAIVTQVFNAYVDFYGSNGLMLQEVFPGIVSEDCSGCSCGWCELYDFTISDYGWVPWTSGANVYAVYVPGTGFRPDPSHPQSCIIKRQFVPDVIPEKIRAITEYLGGCAVGQGALFAHEDASDGLTGAVPLTTGIGYIEWVGSTSGFDWIVADADTSADCSFAVGINAMRLEGHGTAPGIGVAC